MIFKIAIKNIFNKPLNFLLGWLLLTVSVGIISLLLLVQQQIEQQFTNDIKGVDMVLGAKGSPLQMILSAVYHMDAPTGNIKYTEAEKWMKHPFVESAIPLAYGDSYKGYSVLGTTTAYLDKYNAAIKDGKLYANDFEVVVGSTVSNILKLKLGDTFLGTHGDKEGGEVHKAHHYIVTGILKPSGSVIDNLIIGNIESVWKMHEHHEEKKVINGAAAAAEEEDPNEADELKQQEITAVLLKFRNPMAQIQLPRIINTGSNMMAAVPAIEVNRLFSLLGIGIDTLKKMAWGIMILSALSVFITLFNALKDRKYELALMRTMGGSRTKLMLLVLLESMLLCISGFICGIILSRTVLYFLSKAAQSDYHFSFKNFSLQLPEEKYLFFITMAVGIAAALIPAVKAYRLNISKTLANG
ncbi:MAG: FtsX-like permease family protein [Ferruginibacter sp.]